MVILKLILNKYKKCNNKIIMFAGTCITAYISIYWLEHNNMMGVMDLFDVIFFNTESMHKKAFRV